MADVKGDLSGIALAGTEKPPLARRAEQIGRDDYSLQAYPIN